MIDVGTQDLSIYNVVIASFAESCEKLNAYARHLDREGPYTFVVAREDIRAYETGWQLTKWVEASLNETDDFRAEWWLELSFANNAWLVTNYVSISPNGCYLEFPEKSAVSIEDLRQALDQAVAELVNADVNNHVFKSEVERHMRSRGNQ